MKLSKSIVFSLMPSGPKVNAARRELFQISSATSPLPQDRYSADGDAPQRNDPYPVAFRIRGAVQPCTSTDQGKHKQANKRQRDRQPAREIGGEKDAPHRIQSEEMDRPDQQSAEQQEPASHA
ncbi:hypothetical protein LRS12_10905 [Sphingomonas sp. J344]|uniref:hypothetical protein n=1 Tax=Sphingomonas sp. J344 TaxID=2898434 RepID=UPI0021512C4E|nr:hypothetical protein [Sphingomonas sp. J344]MCR5871179.1 hypothetical protein [Sphingomonas sp. J344]